MRDDPIEPPEPTAEEEREAVLAERSGSAPSLCAVIGSHANPPLVARVSIEANRGTPALASMIAHILLEAGATVSFGDDRAEMPQNGCNLLGLHVHIDRLTWVRDEETERWPRGQNNLDEGRRNE